MIDRINQPFSLTHNAYNTYNAYNTCNIYNTCNRSL